jgi:hypothetical protein
MVPECCHNCVYSCWDLCQAMLTLAWGFPHRPLCANQPDTPGLMRATPVGRVCRNYRPRPATPEGDVKRIPLTGGSYAYVDAADYEWLSRYNWRLYNGGDVARVEKGKMIFMHREIMQPPAGMVVDHIDGNKANNCRFSLRVCTPAENRRNRIKHANTSSRFKGVGYDKRSEKYYAKFGQQGHRLWLGYFDDEREAARAYDHKAVECAGPFAWVNFPEEWPAERVRRVYRPHQARSGGPEGKEKRAKGKNRKPHAQTRGRRAGKRRTRAGRPEGRKRGRRERKRATGKTKRTK